MNENQRFLTALILSFIFVYFYTGWLAKKYSISQTEQHQNIESVDREAVAADQQLSDSKHALNLQSRAGFFENDELKTAVISSGGVLTDVDILKIKASLNDPRPYRIISAESGHYLFGVIKDGRLDSSAYDIFESGDERSVIIKSSDGGIVKSLSFKESPYKIEAVVESKNPIKLVLKGFNGEEDSRYNIKNFVMLDSKGKFKRDPLTSKVKTSDAKGFGIESLHFALFLVSKNTSLSVTAETVDNSPTIIIDPRSERLVLELFIGPKELKILESLGDPYIKLLDLGFFALLADPILRMLLLIAKYVENFGLAIVILTVLIRMALYPVSSYGYRAMEKLKEIQPEIERLRKQYENDPQALNRELILLYQRKKVNPMSGCLPILIQIPIFFGLYSALLHAVELRLQPFFAWIKDLSSPDYLYLGPIPLPMLTLLFGASLIYQQRLNPPQFTDPAQEAVFKWMPYIFVALFIIFPMPSGLILYWLINNLSSIAQQVLIKKSGIKSMFITNLFINLILVVVAFLLTLI